MNCSIKKIQVFSTAVFIKIKIFLMTIILYIQISTQSRGVHKPVCSNKWRVMCKEGQLALNLGQAWVRFNNDHL